MREGGPPASRVLAITLTHGEPHAWRSVGPLGGRGDVCTAVRASPARVRHRNPAFVSRDLPARGVEGGTKATGITE